MIRLVRLVLSELASDYYNVATGLQEALPMCVSAIWAYQSDDARRNKMIPN